MKKTRFMSDVYWSSEMSNTFYYPLYMKLAYDGRFVTIVNSEYSAFSGKLQSREIDVFMQYWKDDVISIGVEEKIQRAQWGSLFVETDSCTVNGYERIGWVESLEADYLNYGFGIKDPNCRVNTDTPDDYIALDTYWIQFPPFREWFQANLSLFEEKITHQSNHSAGRIVPILPMTKYPSSPCLARSGVLVERYLCERDRCIPVPLETKLTATRIKTAQIRRNLNNTLDHIYQMKKLQGFDGDND